MARNSRSLLKLCTLVGNLSKPVYKSLNPTYCRLSPGVRGNNRPIQSLPSVASSYLLSGNHIAVSAMENSKSAQMHCVGQAASVPLGAISFSANAFSVTDIGLG